jgi:hypothetical protein
MLQGLERTASLMRLYKVRVDLSNKSDSHGIFEPAVVELYSRILEYQARMVCHMSRDTAKRAISNIMKADNGQNF